MTKIWKLSNLKKISKNLEMIFFSDVAIYKFEDLFLEFLKNDPFLRISQKFYISESGIRANRKNSNRCCSLRISV